MILNIFSYSIKIEKNNSNKELLRRSLEQKRIDSIYENAKYSCNDIYTIR